MIIEKLTINKPVIEYKNSVPLNPKVSIVIMTYNHENYIAQCIESIISQATNFDIEIMIGEDDSTDNTRNICIDYANKYPNILRLFLHNKENKIIDNGSPNGMFNQLYTVDMCRGEYIAFCEGDDFWHNTKKLQLQHDFLIENPEFKTVTTDFTKLYVDQGTKKSAFNMNVKKQLENKTVELDNFFEHQIKILRTSTYFFKSEVLKSFDPLNMVSAGDIQMILHARDHGKIMYLAVDTATYRIMTESASKSKDFSKRQHFFLNYIKFMEVAIEHYNLDNKERSYLKKQKMMYGIREASESKKVIKTILLSIEIVLNGYLSKNTLRNIKHSFRK